ncbi:MAG: ParB/RepB/Spo0J family partition protein [Planctomycetaceae bacterium]|nr:ParB/RepB/Spo0J family partition protein [Planctomycetaceae bacterium]
MSKERRLGRGLEALLGARPAERGLESGSDLLTMPGSTALRNAAESPVAAGLPEVGVYDIDSNPFQPRQEFDEAEIESLAESLREHGLLQPLVVRRIGERYQLISGERRLRAAIKAGWSNVPVQVRDADDRQMAELAIVENLQRRDLGPLEKAASFQAYLETYRATQEELAGRLQIDRSTIANLIRLLELPAEVQQALRRGSITQGHARALLPLGDEREQVAFAARIEREQLSVRQTESLVQDSIRAADDPALGVVGRDEKAPSRRRGSHHLGVLEQQLRGALGTRVDLREGSRGKGKIVVHFNSHDEFERLRAILCGETGRKSQVG